MSERDVGDWVGLALCAGFAFIAWGLAQALEFINFIIK
jgi:hypothetical protein